MSAGKLNILITSAWYPSDRSTNGIFVKEQAEALARRGHHVTIVIVSYESFGSRMRSLFSSAQTSFDAASGVRLLHTHVVLSPLNRFAKNPLIKQRKVIQSSVIRQVRAHYGNQKPDLVHHHCLSDNAYIARELAQDFGIPYFFTEHSSYPSDEILHKFNPFESKQDRIDFVKHAASCIGVTSTWAAIHGKIYGREYTVIPNMIIDYFLQPSDVEKNASFTFCCIAVFDKNKSQGVLIRAFAAAFSDNSNVRLVLAGTGPSLAQCKSEAQRLGLADRVVFTGKLDRAQIRDVLDESHVGMLVSNNETFGITLAEAMFRGLPVISTRSGGPEELVSETTGLLTPIGDVDAIAAAMRDMHQNYERYSPEQIRNYVRERYAESVIMIQLEQLYYANIHRS